MYLGYYVLNNTAGKQAYVTCSATAGASGSWTKPFLYGSNHEAEVAAWGGKFVYAIADGSLIVSADNCASWTRIKPTSPLGSEPMIAVYGPNVYVSGETKGNMSNARLTSTNDNGKTWSKTINLTATNAWHPMIGAFGNSAWVAILQHPGGSAANVMVFTTTNGGTTWNAPVSLSGKGTKTSNEGFPFTVATSDGNNVFIDWSQQISAGYWVMRVSYSADGGITWSPAPGIDVSQNANGQAGNGADVANGAASAFGTHCYVVWQFISGASNQIYFAGS